jgi:signal transduction histidine kinase
LDTLERGIQEWQLKEEDKADPLESIRRMISALSAFLYELTLEMSNGASKELHLGIIDLEDAVEAAAMTVYPMASDKQLRLVVDIDGEVARICWDRTKLKRVLAKLLDDAVRKTPHSGTVTIRANREDERCVISVSDGGEGTRQLPFQRIFDPYASLEGDVGPGLALANELVELHGGDVRVESRVGSGTTVFLSLARSLDEGPEPPGGAIAKRQ